MDLIDALDQAWADAAKVVAGIGRTSLAAPSTCVGWDVRALLNHTLGEARMMTLVNRGGAAGNDQGDLVGEGVDLVDSWTAVGADNVSSWRESGLDGDRSYFYGTFPAQAAALINLGEVVVHGWDLARSTGQPAALDPDHAQLVFDLYSAAPLDGMRATGTLAAEVPVPPDAPVADRLLGLLGRRP